jgi:UDP-N-acetylmuramate-alanine ligase
VLLNLERDHKEPSEVLEMFRAFRANTRERVVVGEDPALAPLAHDAIVFGLGDRAQVRGTEVSEEREGSRFRVDGVPFTLPVPGVHNVLNALAAIAACRALDVPLADMAAPLAAFQGVGRRFQSLGVVRGVEVIDDFAHNAAKLRATLSTARPRGKRILAIYQPHGFGPTRFLKDDLIAAFAAGLQAADRLWLLEIFYAGGTAEKTIASADLAAGVRARGKQAEVVGSREELTARVLDAAQPGDVVLVMGARDPTLSDLAHGILEGLHARV